MPGDSHIRDSYTRYTPSRPDINLRNYCIASDKATSRVRNLLFYPEAQKQWIRDAGTQTDTPISEDLQSIRRSHMLFSRVKQQEEKSYMLQAVRDLEQQKRKSYMLRVSRGLEQQYKHERNIDTVIDILNFNREILEKILGNIYSTWNHLNSLLGPEDRKRSTRCSSESINLLYDHCEEAYKELIDAEKSFQVNPSHDTRKALETFNKTIESSLHLLTKLTADIFDRSNETLGKIEGFNNRDQITSLNNIKIKEIHKKYHDARETYHDACEMYRHAHENLYKHYEVYYYVLVVQSLFYNNHGKSREYHDKFANDVKEHLDTFLGTVDSFLQALAKLKQLQNTLTISLFDQHISDRYRQ